MQLNRPLNSNQNPRQDIAGSVSNRTPPGVPSIISDRQRVRLGAGMRHASQRSEIPGTIADAGRIRIGAGMRRM